MTEEQTLSSSRRDAGKACEERNLATVNTHADWTVHGASQVLLLSQTQDRHTGDIYTKELAANKCILYKNVQKSLLKENV